MAVIMTDEPDHITLVSPPPQPEREEARRDELVKRLNVVPCPNPDCDPEDGCCVCEHTGRVYQFVVDAMTVESGREV